MLGATDSASGGDNSRLQPHLMGSWDQRGLGCHSREMLSFDCISFSGLECVFERHAELQVPKTGVGPETLYRGSPSRLPQLFLPSQQRPPPIFLSFFSSMCLDLLAFPIPLCPQLVPELPISHQPLVMTELARRCFLISWFLLSLNCSFSSSGFSC